MRIPDSNLNKMYQEQPSLWLREVLEARDFRHIEEFALLGAAKPWNIMGTSLMATYVTFRLLERSDIVPSEAAASSLYRECRDNYSIGSFKGVDGYIENKLISMLCGIPLEVSLGDTVMMTADLLVTGFLADKIEEKHYSTVIDEAMRFSSRPEFQTFLEGKTGPVARWQGKRFLGSMIMGWSNWQKPLVEIICNHAFGELPASFFVEPMRRILKSVFPYVDPADRQQTFFDVVASLEEKIGAENVSYQEVRNLLGILGWAVEAEHLDPTCEVGANDESLVFWGTALASSMIEDAYLKQKLLPDVVVSYIEAANIFAESDLDEGF